MPLTTSRGINFGGAILSASPTALDGMAQPFELTTTLDKGYFCKQWNQIFEIEAQYILLQAENSYCSVLLK